MSSKAKNSTAKPPVKAKPEGYGTVTPWIISPNSAELIEFLKAAFGAEETGRVALEDGSIGHAEVRIGDSVVMMFDKRKGWARTPAFLRLYVEDADAVFAQAIKAGAKAVTDVTHLAFGDRVGRVRDPQGNVWWIQTHIEDVSEEEIGRRMSDKKFVDAMNYVMSAELVGPE